MVKALQIAAALCNVQGSPFIVIFAVGDDGRVYQMINGKWEITDPLEQRIDNIADMPLHQTKPTQ